MDRPNLPPFAALRAFEAFGRHGGVRKAAKALGVSHAIVSRHLRSLEAWLEVMLIDRETGSLTTIGKSYHAEIEKAFDRLSAATQSTRSLPRTRLDVWCVPGFAYHWLMGRLPAFARLHPETAIDLRPSDTAPNILRREAHADIRWIRDLDGREPTTERGLSRIRIVRPAVFPVMRPDAEWGAPGNNMAPGRLADLPLLQEDSDVEWKCWFAAFGLESGDLSSAPRLWHAHMTLAAACEGQGVALTNSFLAADYIRSGKLVEIVAEDGSPLRAGVGGYFLTAHSDIWDMPALIRFRKWLSGSVAESPAEWRDQS